MRVLRINPSRVSVAALEKAAAVLRSGGVVAFPTETTYGLAVDPSCGDAVRRIFAIKGRAVTKPLPLVAAEAAAVRRAFATGSGMKKLADRWPAPLTLILPRRPGLRLPALMGRRGGAVRVPTSPWARALAQAAGGLVTSTSANVSGGSNSYSGAAVRAAFAGRTQQPDLLLDAGPLPKRPPSTIVAVRLGRPVVLRQGEERV